MNIDPKEIEMGTRIEHEHTKDDALARKIAMDHLGEDPQYYTRLKKAGLDEGDDVHPTHAADELSKKAKTPEEHRAAHDAHKAALDHHSKLPTQSYRTYNWKKHHTDAMKKHSSAMKECAPCGCGTDEPHGDVSAVVMVGGNDVKNVTQGDVASTQPQLTSSGLGKNGTPKPLASDKLTAPETKKVGANKIATSKTPSMPGAPVSADPMEHFGTALVNLAEGGSQIKKK